MANVKKKSFLGSRLFKRRLLLISLVAAVVLAGALAWSNRSDDSTPSSSDVATDSPSDDAYINLNPATDQEKKETEEHKQNLVTQPSPPPAAPTNKTPVTPVITGGDQNNVRAYIPGVVEDGGTCTATLTKGSSVVTRTGDGFADVSKTVCAPSLAGAGLSPGTWSVVLSYSSSKAEGKSQPYQLEIQ